jgi:hypothetical protein
MGGVILIYNTKQRLERRTDSHTPLTVGSRDEVMWAVQFQVGFGSWPFFLEYAGELRIFALRRRVVKYNIYTTHTLSVQNNTHLAR